MPTIDPGYFAAFNWAWIGLAVVVFVALFFVTAPYGRHLRAGWGPMLPARLGWMVMEAPALLLVGLGLALGSRPLDAYSGLLGAMFVRVRRERSAAASPRTMRERPKSTRRARPASSKRTFSGLRSRWTTPRPWA